MNEIPKKKTQFYYAKVVAGSVGVKESNETRAKEIKFCLFTLHSSLLFFLSSLIFSLQCLYQSRSKHNYSKLFGSCLPKKKKKHTIKESNFDGNHLIFHFPTTASHIFKTPHGMLCLSNYLWVFDLRLIKSTFKGLRVKCLTACSFRLATNFRRTPLAHPILSYQKNN